MPHKSTIPPSIQLLMEEMNRCKGNLPLHVNFVEGVMQRLVDQFIIRSCYLRSGETEDERWELFRQNLLPCASKEQITVVFERYLGNVDLRIGGGNNEIKSNGHPGYHH
jgi:C4-type Zn-finger protein